MQKQKAKQAVVALSRATLEPTIMQLVLGPKIRLSFDWFLNQWKICHNAKVN